MVGRQPVTAKPIASATLDPESILWLLLTAPGIPRWRDEGRSKCPATADESGKAPANGCTKNRTQVRRRDLLITAYYFYVP